jgi:hypothetical protein
VYASLFVSFKIYVSTFVNLKSKGDEKSVESDYNHFWEYVSETLFIGSSDGFRHFFQR